MNTSTRIQHCVFIGIIGCTRSNHLGYQSALPAEASSGNNQRPSLPSHHTGMNKGPALRCSCNEELEIGSQGLQHLIEVCCPNHSFRISVQEIQAPDIGLS